MRSYLKLVSWKAEYIASPIVVLPGWQIKEDTECETPVAVVPETYGGIKIEGKSPYQEANAQLIVAAPELLKALKKLRRAIAPLAAQIICPKDNVLSKQLAIIDAAILKSGPLGMESEVPQ
jgi:hypothetical protein